MSQSDDATVQLTHRNKPVCVCVSHLSEDCIVWATGSAQNNCIKNKYLLIKINVLQVIFKQGEKIVWRKKNAIELTPKLIQDTNVSKSQLNN